ncbi:hypothetical protein REPUB_Repub13aG0022600 [Reevesia pubescens]
MITDGSFSVLLPQMLNPTEFFADIVVEHEYVECTTSAIHALVLFKELYPGHLKKEIENFITNAARYLENIHRPDGSWSIGEFASHMVHGLNLED